MTMDSVGRLFAPALPEAIKRARARAVEHPQLFLKGKATALVQVLITYTDLDALSKPLRFNRETPAKLLGVSTRTIDRILAQLESLGWLKRLPQPRLDDGVWGCTSIRWDAWVINDIFNLPAGANKWRRSDSRAGKSQAQEPSAPLSPNRATEKAHLSSSPKGEVFQNKVVADDSLGQENFDPFGERVKSRRRIPADLEQPMHELGLTPANMCWLMAKCKDKGVRLQQVLAATGQALREKGLKAKNALSWLIYMIGLDRDYAFEAKQRHQAAELTRRSKRRTEWLDELARKAFVAGAVLPNGATVMTHMDGIVTLRSEVGGALSACPAQALSTLLARAHPWWAKRTLRGGPAVRALEAQSSDAMRSRSPGVAEHDREASRASIAAIRALLGRPSPLQRAY